METREVINVRWYNTRGGTFGVVTALDTLTNKTKSYCCVGKGNDEKEDIQFILDWGNTYID